MTAPANQSAMDTSVAEQPHAQSTQPPIHPAGPHPGDEPRANPAVRWLTILIALVLIALSAVVGRDLWYFYQNGDSSDSWLRPVFEFVGSAVIDVTALVVGAVIAIIGLLLIIYAFVPRAHTHVRVDSPASIWTRPVDIARKATYVTRSEVGNASIQSRADRKKLRVRVEDDGTGASLQERLTHALGNEMQRLKTMPAIGVKVLPKAGQADANKGAPAGSAPGQATAGTALPSNRHGGSTPEEALPEHTQGVQR